MTVHIIYLACILVMLPLYWWGCAGNRQRLGFITLASMALLANASVKSVVGLAGLSLMVFYLGKRLEKHKGLLPLFLSICLPLSVLVACKYLLPLIQSLGIAHVPMIMPLGVSYFTFKMIHYLVESCRGRFQNTDGLTFMAYIFFFPMFISGPIERLDRFKEQAGNLKFNWADISLGGERILVGAIKKFVLADFLLSAFLLPPYLLEGLPKEVGWFGCFLAGLAKFLHTYFDFSGYTDMVLGTGRLFGFRLMENFNFPLLRSNLAEFWRNWHMSLSGWARDYVYFPILARFRMAAPALLATMLTIGVWHGPRITWVLWGLHHGMGLVLLNRYHQWVNRQPRFHKLRDSLAWRIMGMAAVWWYVAVGHTLTITTESLSGPLSVYLYLISFGAISP